MSCTVRYAARDELARVNDIRAMVNQVHVNGRPDIFRPDFCEELRQHIYQKFDADDSDVIIAVINDVICGYAVAEYIDKPLSPYSLARRYYRIEEFGVDEAYRRRGVARAMIDFCKNEAARMRFPRIELDMWEFNQSALAFYEKMGFQTYRRYMELDVRQIEP